MKNRGEYTFGEKVAVLIILAMIVGGAVCVAYSILAAIGLVGKSDDKLLIIAGVGLIALAFMYRWAIFTFPKWLEAKEDEEAEKKAEEETARK